MSTLEKFAKKTPAKAKKSYPVIEAPVELVDSVIESSKVTKKASDEEKSLKSKLRDAVLNPALSQISTDQSFVLKGSGENELLFTLSDGFRSNTDLSKVPEKFHDSFETKSTLEVSGKAVQNEEFLEELLKLAEKYGVSSAIKLKEIVRPKTLSILVEKASEVEAQLLDEVVKFPTTFKNR